MTARKRHCPRIVLAGLLLLSGSLPLTGPAEALSGIAGLEPCCESNNPFLTAPDQQETPADSSDNCCTGGCTECGLRCCGSTFSEIPTQQDLQGRALASAPLLHTTCSFASVDRAGIDHPPRVSLR